MRLYQLEGFYYVGKTGGYTAATKAIGYPVGEPAIHQQVKKLERNLGVALVRREGKRIALTPEGRLLFEWTRPFFQALPMVERRLKSEKGGTVLIAGTDVAVDQFLVPRLVKLRRRMPGAIFSITKSDSMVEILNRVEGLEVDFGISAFPSLPVGLAIATVGEVEAVVAVPVGHRWAKKRRLSLTDLASQPWVVFERGSYPRAVLDEELRKRELFLSTWMEATTLDVQLNLIANGLGIGVVPRLRGTRSSPGGITYVPLTDQVPVVPLQVVWKAAQPLPPLLERVRRVLTNDKGSLLN